MVEVKYPEDWEHEEVEAFRKKHGPFRADDGLDQTSDREVRELMTNTMKFRNDARVQLIASELEKDKPISSTNPLRQN